MMRHKRSMHGEHVFSSKSHGLQRNVQRPFKRTYSAVCLTKNTHPSEFRRKFFRALVETGQQRSILHSSLDDQWLAEEC
jgi:hypothetical protein